MSLSQTPVSLYHNVFPGFRASPTSYLLEAGDPNVVQNFGEAWVEAFRQSPAFMVWDRITDPVIFDIVEARFVPSWFHLD